MRTFKWGTTPTVRCDRQYCHNEEALAYEGKIERVVPLVGYASSEVREEHRGRELEELRWTNNLPLPAGWLSVHGAQAHAEVCSLRCLRLWAQHREREHGR